MVDVVQIVVALVVLAIGAYVVLFAGKKGSASERKGQDQDGEKKNKKNKNKKKSKGKKNKTEDDASGVKNMSLKQLQRLYMKGKNRKGKVKVPDPTDPLFVTALKGHTEPILDAVFAPSGTALATCSEDRTLRLWPRKSFEGSDHKPISSRIELDHITHFAFSTDGKAAAGVLARDQQIRLFKVSSKTGFTPVKDIAHSHRCGRLPGHSAPTAHFAFSRDSALAASVARDGTWKCFNINVRWDLDEDPRLLSENTYAQPSSAPRIAISSSNYTLCVGSKQTIEMFSVHSGERLYAITDAHAPGMDLTHLCYDMDDEFIISTAYTRVHVWRNLPQKREMIARLTEKVRTERNQSGKDRIKAQVAELQKNLKAYGW
ncbi:hypothetical protein PTSG_08824 [Salpingoeca rosetta]|uniref:Uncharacterized protein n=1 Tax=Salpingoeca rosetta (strain ATCC 50818 / BSB-021) TaxID=946362 RepID=F2UKT4_SALR5|nr:uncharacterized protein PTSG_08824 [Salpingoeca rosetta]EGD77733.1 hypothetical protein PTSG_08824 [Salpingoeca rosetta]|eukprot:XP_004990209.1 hypothetical protein PTSG_08824 [Salpingoeca rosetta]